MEQLSIAKVLEAQFGLDLMHQPIPPAPIPRADPWALALFLPWMANSQGWGLLSCQIPQGGDKKRRQMPHPPSTLQHFSLIAQSNNAILSILMFSFFVSINVFLCNSARILTILMMTCTSLWF